MTLSGWGRVHQASAQAFRPERLRAAEAAVRSRPAGGLIAYGAGRSYGDAALNSNGHVLLSGRLDRVLDLDIENATLVSEPGVTLRELQRVLVPRGLMLPALPGTGFATIGGAVANDVHGKNHDRHGSMGDYVEWFEAADGGRLLAQGFAAVRSRIIRCDDRRHGADWYHDVDLPEASGNAVECRRIARAARAGYRSFLRTF